MIQFDFDLDRPLAQTQHSPFERFASAGVSSGAWPLAAESQERISEQLMRMGFSRMSHQWGQKALETLARLLQKTRARAVEVVGAASAVLRCGHGFLRSGPSLDPIAPP